MKQALCSDPGMVILSVATLITTGALSLPLLCRAEIFTRHCVRKKNPFGQEIMSPRLHIVSWLERLWQIEKKKKKFKRKHIVGPPFSPHRLCASSQRLTVVQKRAPQVSYSQIRLIFVIQISHSNRVLEFLFKRFITCLV